MKEWVMVANRAEAKIFERDNKDQDLRWLETLENKKGRRKERDFNTDKPGISHAKFGSSCSPHNLEGKNTHAEIIANHFAHTIAKVIINAYRAEKFRKATIFAPPHLLGKIKKEIGNSIKDPVLYFVSKNIEKANTADIRHFIT